KDGVNCEIIERNIMDFPLIKVLIITDSQEKLMKIKQYIEIFNFQYNTMYSEQNYLQILPDSVSKGKALKKLVNLSDNNADIETICVGDNLNDLSMLKVANKGFIVENCHASLKKYAYHKTLHHNKHAIADIVYNYL